MNTKDMFLQNTEGGTIIAAALLVASSAISYFALRRMRAF
jgi:hypothetical protein